MEGIRVKYRMVKGEEKMPLIHVNWNVKASDREKKELMDFITDTVSEVTNTDRSRIYVFICHYEKEDVSNPDCPVVQIDWVDLPERTPEAKKEITERIIKRLSEWPEIMQERILVLFSDVPRHNARIGG